MSISGDIEVSHYGDVHTFCDGGISVSPVLDGCCPEGRAGFSFFHRNVLVHKVEIYQRTT
jgi:hypothetical protein